MKNAPIRYADALGNNAADKRIDILRRIGEVGSISEAARGAGVSYKAAWQAIEILTNLAGASLVEKIVGGAGGGGAQLTQTGKKLLHASDLLNAARGEVIAGLTGESSASEAGHGYASLGLRTSMRNHFPCKIKALRKKVASVRVELELPGGDSMHSTITSESAQLLGLHPGQSVLALCKATAVTVASQLSPREGFNTLTGVVKRGSRSSGRAEIGLQLESGLQLVGFADAGHGLKAGSRAMAQIDEAGVVIAVAG